MQHVIQAQSRYCMKLLQPICLGGRKTIDKLSLD